MKLVIDKIRIGARRRPLSESKVAQIADSIGRIGLLSPILVTDDSPPTLVAGRHRLSAAQRLGWIDIEASTVSAAMAKLAEIDENLARNELSVMEQSEHLAARDELLRELGVRWTNGENQYTKRGGGTVPPPRTTAQIAADAGLGESATHRRLQIARDIAPEARDILRDTPHANATTLLVDLARVKDPERQTEAARAIADAPAMPVREAREVVREVAKAAPKESAVPEKPKSALKQRPEPPNSRAALHELHEAAKTFCATAARLGPVVRAGLNTAIQRDRLQELDTTKPRVATRGSCLAVASWQDERPTFRRHTATTLRALATRPPPSVRARLTRRRSCVAISTRTCSAPCASQALSAP